MIKDVQLLATSSGKKILREKAKSFDFESMTRADINQLVREMKAAMRAANGIGLAANQVGLNINMFVAEVPDSQGRQKFYGVFNPVVERTGKETTSAEEGCLSVPGMYGEVERPERITLSGQDKQGKPIKIKAWGLLSRVFQHEVDHLTGKLFIDTAKHLARAEESR